MGKMKQIPCVSIIIPVYNEEAIIVQNLSKIYEYLSLLQGIRDFELIIIDDGSSDRTGELAEEFVHTHEKARVLHHLVNLNLGNALKTGFGSAKG